MENKIWICTETFNPVFFANEEAARLDYRKWCEQEGEEFDENVFQFCYYPLNEYSDIWTIEDVQQKGPFSNHI